MSYSPSSADRISSTAGTASAHLASTTSRMESATLCVTSSTAWWGAGPGRRLVLVRSVPAFSFVSSRTSEVLVGFFFSDVPSWLLFLLVRPGVILRRGSGRVAHHVGSPREALERLRAVSGRGVVADDEEVLRPARGVSRRVTFSGRGDIYLRRRFGEGEKARRSRAFVRPGVTHRRRRGTAPRRYPRPRRRR